MVVIACGALANEIIQLQRLNHWSFFELECIPAQIHNHPEQIPELVKAKILKAKSEAKEVFVAFADCGTGGLLDKVLREFEVSRLPGAHCYEFYATSAVFEALSEEELGSFYLTDFLARHFDKLVIEGLGIRKYPELKEMYFGNYKRLVYLAQTENLDLLNRAKIAAEQLGLEFHSRYTGYGTLATSFAQLAKTPAQRSQT